jgi:hypothetical protein
MKKKKSSKCFTCLYWKKIRGAMRGICKRFPPVIVSNQIELSTDESLRKTDPLWMDIRAIDGIWPAVWEFEWCGEYVAKNKKRGESSDS